MHRCRGQGSPETRRRIGEEARKAERHRVRDTQKHRGRGTKIYCINSDYNTLCYLVLFTLDYIIISDRGIGAEAERHKRQGGIQARRHQAQMHRGTGVERPTATEA